jgi:hypothetical protein
MQYCSQHTAVTSSHFNRSITPISGYKNGEETHAELVHLSEPHSIENQTPLHACLPYRWIRTDNTLCNGTGLWVTQLAYARISAFVKCPLTIDRLGSLIQNPTFGRRTNRQLSCSVLGLTI